MYTLLLVDDEAMLVASLRARILHLGDERVKEVLNARSGEEALDIMRKQKIDVVFADMLMQGMSGLELIRAAGELDSGCQFIVLSGHDDYTLIRESFKAGSVDYLLKPISESELRQVLDKAFAHADEYKRERQVLNDSIARCLCSAVDGVSINHWLNDVERTGIQSYLPLRHFSVFCMQGGMDSMGVLSKYSAILSDAQVAWGYFSVRRSDILFLVACYEHDTQLSAVRCFTRTVAQDEATVRSRIAFSEGGEGFEGLYYALSDTSEAIEGGIFYPHRVNLRIKPRRDAQSLLTREEIAALYETRPPEVFDAIKRIIDQCITDETLQQSSYQSLSALYNQLINRLELIVTIPYKDEGRRPLVEFSYADELANYLHGLNEFARIQSSEKRNMHVIDVAVRYISEHYAEPIDMRRIADMVSVNYTYFSELFKLHTGENFSQNLLRVRMRKAKELLDNPLIRVSDIAQNVGYENAKHFARAFKKYHGITPSQYRMGGFRHTMQIPHK